MAAPSALVWALAFVVGCSGGNDPNPGKADGKTKKKSADAEPIDDPRASGDPAASTHFQFPADGVGQLLEANLSPPRAVPVEPLPFTQTPAPRAAPQPERALTGRLWPLSPVGAGRLAGPLRPFPAALPRPTAAMDVPPMSAMAALTLPVQPVMAAAGPLTFVAAPPADRPLNPPPSPTPPEQRPTVTDDPTRAAALGVLLGPTVAGNLPPAPAETNAPTDPLERARAAELRNPPPDADAPEASRTLPAPPMFVVKEQ